MCHKMIFHTCSMFIIISGFVLSVYIMKETGSVSQSDI